MESAQVRGDLPTLLFQHLNWVATCRSLTPWSDAGGFSPLQAKIVIRELLPNGLRESISKVRSSVAYAVSAIAHWDWPEAWPQLFNLLMEMLVSGDVNAVHGAMRVLTGMGAMPWPRALDPTRTPLVPLSPPRCPPTSGTLPLGRGSHVAVRPAHCSPQSGSTLTRPARLLNLSFLVCEARVMVLSTWRELLVDSVSSSGQVSGASMTGLREVAADVIIVVIIQCSLRSSVQR